MNVNVECGARIEPDTVHRYVTGRLTDAETEAFELHLLTCHACQRDVREGAGIGAALRDDHVRARPARPRRVTWVVPAVAAAAVLLVVAWPRDPLRSIAGVEAPAFDGLPLRTSTDSAAMLADSGMDAYAQRDYENTARYLARAVTHRSTPGTQFFLGTSRLLTRDAAGALAPLALAMQPPGNPYSAEARYYRAKAWLQLGRADSALAQLHGDEASGAWQVRLTALADSIRARRP